MKISEILQRKGDDVITVRPDQTVLDAMRVLDEHRIGAVVVTRDDNLVGILSERDVLRLGARDPALLTDTRVRDIMTADVITAPPEHEIRSVMDTMTDNRIRHLPIVQNDRLVGIVSIGDVVNECRKSVEDENRHLHQYIHGVR